MTSTPFSDDELRALPAVIPLTVAGRALGLGSTKTSELANRGEFPCPVLTLGRKRVVRRVSLFEVIGFDASAARADTAGTVARADRPRQSRMSFDDLLALPASFSIDVAGKALSMGRDKARNLHRTGRFPINVHVLANSLICTRHELFAYLGLDDQVVQDDGGRQPGLTAEHETQVASKAAAVQPPSYVVLAVPVGATQLAELLGLLAASGRDVR
jgi:hypothetical protein